MSLGHGPIKRIERLRALRVRLPVDLSLRDTVARQLREARTQSAARRSVLAGELLVLIPKEFFPAILDARLSRGTLMLSCGDASASFALNRWLDGGGRDALIASRNDIRDVRVSV